MGRVVVEGLCILHQSQAADGIKCEHPRIGIVYLTRPKRQCSAHRRWVMVTLPCPRISQRLRKKIDKYHGLNDSGPQGLIYMNICSAAGGTILEGLEVWSC